MAPRAPSKITQTPRGLPQTPLSTPRSFPSDEGDSSLGSLEENGYIRGAQSKERSKLGSALSKVLEVDFLSPGPFRKIRNIRNIAWTGAPESL
jgi:hypothetical protein